ncbi:MAG: alpha/beta fold hydrolase [Dehalococcoidia bacterium]
MPLSAYRPKLLVLILVPLIALAVASCTSDPEPTPDPSPTPIETASTPDPTPTETTPDPSPSPTSTTPDPSPTPAGTDPGSVGDIETTDCAFEVPNGHDVECGYITVPEEWDEPGANIRLHFAVFAAATEDKAPDPLVYLSGGPGGSALQVVPQTFNLVYEPLLQNRDLVVFDQRGTGFSEPSLYCEEYTAVASEVLALDVDPSEAQELAIEAVSACRQRLTAEGINLASFNTANNAADVDALRNALGYEEWNVYGVSYGSRLATRVMQDHPDGIRSVILDSAYPPDADLYVESPRNLRRAMDTLFQGCADDPACAAAYPNLETTFTDLVNALDENPAPYAVSNPMTGQSIESQLTGSDFIGFLFNAMYVTDIIPYLPELIKGVQDGRLDTVGVLQGAFLADLEFFSMGMQLSVQCQEEVAFTDRETLAASTAEFPELSNFFEAQANLGAGLFEICDLWDVGEADANVNDPVTSDIPALTLAGEYDPITPPRWGQQVSGTLPNGHYIEAPAAGHGIVLAHDCFEQIAQAFLDDPAAEPPSDCVAGIESPAFTAGDVDPETTPYTHPGLGFTTVVPADWTEVLPGAFQESLLVSLVIDGAPGATPEQILQGIALQLGLSDVPGPEDSIQTADLEWDLYRFESGGQVLDIAMAAGDSVTYLVQLASTPDRRSAHYERVFIPALENLEPAE